VGLLDTQGQAMPGYSAADCEPITNDHVRQAVAWTSGGDLADLTGQEVAIELEFEGPVVVYALAFSD
jgi:hypothetical protein